MHGRESSVFKDEIGVLQLSSEKIQIEIVLRMVEPRIDKMLDDIVRRRPLGRAAVNALSGAVEKLFRRIVELDIAGEFVTHHQEIHEGAGIMRIPKSDGLRGTVVVPDFPVHKPEPA